MRETQISADARGVSSPMGNLLLVALTIAFAAGVGAVLMGIVDLSQLEKSIEAILDNDRNLKSVLLLVAAARGRKQ